MLLVLALPSTEGAAVITGTGWRRGGGPAASNPVVDDSGGRFDAGCSGFGWGCPEKPPTGHYEPVRSHQERLSGFPGRESSSEEEAWSGSPEGAGRIRRSGPPRARQNRDAKTAENRGFRPKVRSRGTPGNRIVLLKRGFAASRVSLFPYHLGP